MPTFLKHFDTPETFMSAELAIWWYYARDTAILLLTARKYRRKSYYSNKTDNLLLYPPEHLIKENIVNGRKPKDQPRFNGSKSAQSSTIEWLDGLLTAEDIDILERDTTSIEYLAGKLISLVSDGYGCAVKYDLERERYNCTIYRPPNGKQRKHLGLSGNSPDLRDAILVTLYRFDSKFGGVIDDSSPDASSAKQKRRFG